MPFLPDEVATAIAIKEIFDARLCAYIMDDQNIQTEVDRYIAWPAQALSYKLGQMKILELRDRAKKELGDKFDIRAFHDQVIDSGALPLDVLGERINAWIASQKAGGSAAH